MTKPQSPDCIDDEEARWRFRHAATFMASLTQAASYRFEQGDVPDDVSKEQFVAGVIAGQAKAYGNAALRSQLAQRQSPKKLRYCDV